MPYIAIKSFPKDDETIRKVAERINETLLELWGCPQAAINISYEAIPPEVWDERMERGEIAQTIALSRAMATSSSSSPRAQASRMSCACATPSPRRRWSAVWTSKRSSAIIGHVSAATTLNVYTHVTTTMQRQAARKIDKSIAGREAEAPRESTEKLPLPPSGFNATKGKHRKPGTGCVSQISETLWEGRYSPVCPDGKKRPHNIYAHSEKAKIAAERERIKVGA